MRIYATIAFDWHGERREAVSPPSKRPDTVIDLRDEWVHVGHISGGTMLVAWEDVRELHGWAPVPEEDR